MRIKPIDQVRLFTPSPVFQLRTQLSV